MPQTDYIAVSGPAFSGAELDALFASVLERVFSDLASGVPVAGPAKSRGAGSVLILPPDLSRIHSGAGLLTGSVCRLLTGYDEGNHGAWRLGAILPALGTHRPLTAREIAFMFPGCPPDKFLPHRWREDTVELGRLEAEWVEAAFTGSSVPPGGQRAEFSVAGSISGQASGQTGTAGCALRAFYSDWPVQVNRILRDGLPPDSGSMAGPFSLIVSIGQVVPHEVAGMANHAKNVFVGTGGTEAINKSHYLGALYGLERIMGKTETPVRALFDEAFRRYGNLLPPVLWVLTVVDPAGAVRGLFSGFGRSCFEKAAALSEKLNISRLEEPARKIVVWLSPREYRSMWLGNKAVYRTRMAIAPGGELVILAPGLDCFGEDSENDALIRRYGYRGAEKIRQAVEAEALDLSDGGTTDSGAATGHRPPDSTSGGIRRSLSAAAHLIHGSSEGCFTIRYCTDPARGLSREEIESVGYQWGSLDEAIACYVPELQSGRRRQFANDPPVPETGWKTSANGDRFYFVANPALGLWRA